MASKKALFCLRAIPVASSDVASLSVPLLALEAVPLCLPICFHPPAPP